MAIDASILSAEYTRAQYVSEWGLTRLWAVVGVWNFLCLRLRGMEAVGFLCGHEILYLAYIGDIKGNVSR